MRTKILILGAGKSSTVLIQYLQQKAVENNWTIVLADGDMELAKSKLKVHPSAKAVLIDIANDDQRKTIIKDCDIVVSMLPHALHYLVAVECIMFNKHLFTASYVDDSMRQLAQDIEKNNLFFLCEMGLDPGIDHMSAMELIDRIKEKGGKIKGFKSHCGGLIADVSDNNPWHYKISWNPQNIIMAGKAGALFLEHGFEKRIHYVAIFNNAPMVQIPQLGALSYYPNRDSLHYIKTYALNEVVDFMRTTLRHPDFCKGWDAIIKLGLTNENILLERPLSIYDWFSNHLKSNGLEQMFSYMMKDALLNTMITYLDLDSTETIPHELKCNAHILQWILERKWKLETGDKDRVVMLHEITYTLNEVEYLVQSSMVIDGENETNTAMAKTVGLPLAMAVCAFIKGDIQIKGLHIPTLPSIYQPILKTLKENGIQFHEIETRL